MDRLQALNQLEKTIEGQRHLLLQAHGVLTCLYEVLLHGEGEAECRTRKQPTSRVIASTRARSSWTPCAFHRCSMHWDRTTKSMNGEFCT